MTGATEFTRKAGLAGLVSTAAGLLLVGTPRPSTGDAAAGTLGLAALVLLVLWLVSLAGLVVRHRMYRWMRAVLFVGVFAIALGLTVDASLVGYSLAAALALLLLGILAEGLLPRLGALLALLSWPAGFYVSDLAGLVLSFAGFTWLHWAMWREPLARGEAGGRNVAGPTAGRP